MTEDPSHTDKLGRPLSTGDRVELVYAGDQHYARVAATHLDHDVPHVELEIISHATVPAAWVTKVSDGDGTPTLPPTPPADPDLQPKETDAPQKTTTHHRPAAHRSRTHKPATRTSRSR